MIHVDIICVGKVKEAFFRDAAAEYEKRLAAYMKLRILEVKDEKTEEGATEAENLKVLKTEAERISQYLDDKALRVALAIEGKEYDSEGFSGWFFKKAAGGISHIQFVIGGSLGLHEDIKKGAMLLSFSKMTFPHQLMRVILLEQLYRAQKIGKNEPYHK